MLHCKGMTERQPISVGNVALRGGGSFFLIAGPVRDRE